MERGINHAIGIAVDEWGGSRIPSAKNKDTPARNVTNELGVNRLPASPRDEPRVWSRRIMKLEEALIVALFLNAFIRHSYSVRFANFTTMLTAMGINFPSLAPFDKPLVLESIFYPFELYSQTCGQLALDVFWNSDTFTGTYLDRAYKGIRTLDVAATLDNIRKQLVIYVVNQSQKEPLDTAISLANGQFTGNAKSTVINGPDVKSENTEQKPEQVRARDTFLKVSGNSFSYIFEPHSVTALVCPIS